MYNLKRLKKKGISPVIASIILIAITIAIAIAVAGWVFGLFGAYGGGAAIKVVSVTYGGTVDDDIDIEFANSGATDDSVTSIDNIGTVTVTNPATTTIPQNDPSTILTFDLSGDLVVGQTYTLTIHLGSGNIIVHAFKA
ncbi:MAG: hypothetical protein HXX80_02135 [Nitrososphaerales archaeon]|nr:hypothetical protein [Nitrososphaerales archaeon]